jgi:hypothetical protein
MNDRQETNAVIEIMKGNDNPVADFFSSPSSTPETDAEGYGDGRHPWVATEFARKLERERNKAQKELSSIHQWIDRNHPDGFIDSQTYFQNLERVTDNWYDRLDRLEVDAKRFVRERDEAREQNAKLREIAERLSICAENLEKYTWHCNDQGCDCGRCKLAIEQKELRAELDQIKEGEK